MPVYVVGHKNPDTDSVASAIAYADLKRKEGIDAIPAVATEINKGTALVLEKFGVKKPEKVDFKSLPDAQVILVDHNEEGQRADGIIKEHVTEVIDHHRFADFSSATPIYIRVLPWGSTAAIVTKMYQECNHVPEKHIAGLLLSAILTDTLMFKSPTTTENDKAMAAWLNEIAEIDMEAHANEIFKAKSDISDMKAEEVVKKDYKEFHFNSKINMAVAVFETVDAAGPLKRKAEFINEVNKIKEDRGLDYVLFVVVDILKEVAYFVTAGEAEAELATHVFGGTVNDGLLEVPGIVSRKKQMIPPLEEHFAGLN